jgi:hypothetical protein
MPNKLTWKGGERTNAQTRHKVIKLYAYNLETVMQHVRIQFNSLLTMIPCTAKMILNSKHLIWRKFDPTAFGTLQSDFADYCLRLQ